MKRRTLVAGTAVLLAGCTSILGIDSVSLWQTGANDGGAIDGASSDGVGPSEATTAVDAVADQASTATIGSDDAGSGEGGSSEGGGNTCPSAEIACDGGCVANNLNNCGACGHDCSSLTNVVGVVGCVAGGCVFDGGACRAGFAHCGPSPDQGCETSIATPGNCGICGSTCEAGAPLCGPTASTYSCESSCTSSAPTPCGTTCTNTQSDSQNCNACGHVCTTGVAHAQATCTGGACGYQCTASYPDACDGGCAAFATDMANCGSCGHSCPIGANCAGGICQCPSGTLACSGNCATCSTPPTGATSICSGTTCTYACTVSGDVACGGACVNETTDDSNCGTCGHSCLPGHCGGGKCQPWAIFSPADGFATDGTIAIVSTSVMGAPDSVVQVPALQVMGTSILLKSPTTVGGVTHLSIGGGLAAWSYAEQSETIVATAILGQAASYGSLSGGTGQPGTVDGVALGPSGPTLYELDRGTPVSATGCKIDGCIPAADGGQQICSPAATFTSSANGNPVVASAGAAFFTDQANGIVYEYTGTATLKQLAIGQAGATGLSVSASDAYWVVTGASGTFAVNGVALTSGAVPFTAVATQSGSCQATATDGTHVFFMTTSGSLEYVIVGGGTTPTPYYAPSNGTMTVSQLVAAGGALYWLDTGSGMVYGLAGP